MIEKITYIESNQFSPYRNLAVEEYLLLHCEDKECILYLVAESEYSCYRTESKCLERM